MILMASIIFLSAQQSWRTATVSRTAQPSSLKGAALDKHILAEHGEKVECQLCNQTFPVGNLRWHILKEHCHNKVTECSLCEQKFVTKNALKNHIKQVHLSETSTCHICHKEYKDLYHHVKYFHE